MRLISRRRAWPALVALLTLAAAGAPTPLLPPDEAGDGAEEKSTAPAVPSREPFVIERLESAYRFEADGTRTRSLRSRVRIQTEAALKQFGQVALGYESGLERVSITGRVIKPDGRATEIPESAVQDLTTEVSRMAPVYSDLREKHLVVPGLRPGDVLEYEFRFEGLAPLSPGQFWAAHDFNREVVVEDERLRIDVPGGKYVNVKTKPGLDATVEEKDGRRVYSWRSSNLKPREPEQPSLLRLLRKGSDDAEPPAVQLSTFKTWAEVGDWYAGLESGRREPDDAIRARVADLTRDRPDEVARLKALYDYVAQKYRYVGIMFGIGRYQPHAAAEVFRNQYGDCKDKHTLLAAMSEASGLRAQAALTSSSNAIDAAFPSPSQFDHVITYVAREGGAIWLDTTSMVAPFRLLSPTIRGKEALVVAPGGQSALRKIPEEPAVPGLEIRKVEGSVDTIGTLNADVRLSVRGDSEASFRYALREVPEARWPELLRFVVPGVQFQDEVTSVETSDIADTDHPFELRFHLVRRNFLNPFDADPRLELPLGGIAPDDEGELEAGRPIVLGSGKVEYHARLRLPASFAARPPLPVTVTRDYAEYQSSYALDQAVLTADRLLSIRLREIPASRGNDFVAFRRALSSDVQQSVAVKIAAGGRPGEVSGVNTDDLQQSARAAMEQGDAQAAIALLEQAVKTNPKHDGVQADLGAAYLMAAQMEKAEAALKQAIALNPYTPDAENNLGRLYAATRREDEAVKAFRRQIEINPLDDSAHRMLGHVLLEKKKYADAESELAKAATITPNAADLHLDLGKAQLGTGKVTEAKESFARAVELAPMPHVWNEVAYALADRSIALDQAEQYAVSAAATLAAQSMGFHLESLKTRDLQLMGLLGAAWDTLGWVYFKRGKTAAGERYLKAAWELTQDGTAALHLAQLHEAAGRSEKAIEHYALAAAAPRSEQTARERLKSLLGEVKAKVTVDRTREGLQNLRSLTVPGASGDGTAEFFVLLRPPAAVEEVRFISGDAAMKPLTAALKRTTFDLTLPNDHDLRVVRRGFMVCSRSYSGPVNKPPNPGGKGGSPAPPGGGSCDFILMLPQDVHSVK